MSDELNPFISIVASDGDGNALTHTIEIIVDSPAQAIELWQYLRQQASKWSEKHLKG